MEGDQLNSARSAKLDLIGFEESNPTLNASFIGDYDTVKAGLEQKNFDPNYRCNVNGFTALMLSSQEGHQGMIYLYWMELRADPSAQRMTEKFHRDF